MSNAVRIAEETMTTEQAPQTADMDQKMIRPGVNERIAQALITIRNYQTERMAKENLDACMARLGNLYDMGKEDAEILVRNIIKENPQDLKIIYADIIKDARKKVYTGWTILFVYNFALIPVSIAFSPVFLTLAILSTFVLPFLYDHPENAGTFLFNAKKLKKIAGKDYCPFELIEPEKDSKQ